MSCVGARVDNNHGQDRGVRAGAVHEYLSINVVCVWDNVGVRVMV